MSNRFVGVDNYTGRMGVLDFIRAKPVDNSMPTIDAAAGASLSTNLRELTELINGGSASTATRAEALAIPTIARARNILCATGASLPLVSRIISTGIKVKSPRVITQPDSRVIGASTYAWLLEDLWLYGIGYFRITGEYAESKRAADVERIAPDRVEQILDDAGNYVIGLKVDSVEVPKDGLGSVIVFHGLDEGLLNRAGRTIRAAFALEQAALLYAKEPVPQLALKNMGAALPPDRVTKLLDGWTKSRAQRSTAFLNADIAIEKVSIDPKALQLNEARQYVSLELCRTAGLPAYFASAEQTSMTYSNAITERRSLIDFGLRNLLTVVEQTLSLPIFTASTTEVKFDLDDFLRGNPYERAQVYQILSGITDANGNAAITVDEIRKAEDLLL